MWRIQRRCAASSRAPGRRLPQKSRTATDPAACNSASPVDIEAASAPAQKSPTMSGGSPICAEVTIVGRMASAGSTPGKASTPEKPMKRMGTRKRAKVG